MIYELTTVISSLCIHAAYFRKFAVSIPDHHNKADIARKKRDLHEFFGSPVDIKVMFTLHWSLNV